MYLIFQVRIVILIELSVNTSGLICNANWDWHLHTRQSRLQDLPNRLGYKTLLPSWILEILRREKIDNINDFSKAMERQELNT